MDTACTVTSRRSLALRPEDSSPWEGTKGRVWFSAAGTQLKVHSFTEMTKQSARVPLPLQVASYS